MEDLVHVDDAGMIETGEEAPLVQKARQGRLELGAMQRRRRDHRQALATGAGGGELLERDRPTAAQVSPEIGNPEPAAPQHLTNGEVPPLETGAGLEEVGEIGALGVRAAGREGCPADRTGTRVSGDRARADRTLLHTHVCVPPGAPGLVMAIGVTSHRSAGLPG